MSEINGKTELLESDLKVLGDNARLELQLTNTIELLQERVAELEFAQEDVGWQRLSGDSDFEVSITYLKKIVARSRIFFLHNPLIRRAVSLQADYVFAQGVNIEATDDDVNEVVQAFLDDKGNKREISGHQALLMKEQTLQLDGNVFLVLFTDTQGTGKVNIRSILVDEITDIITNPDDLNEVRFYKREWTSRVYTETQRTFTQQQNVAYYPDVDYRADLQMRSNGTLGGHPVYWNAPIYHVKVGALSKSRFGISEVYPALDWAQAHKNFLQDWATIVRMYARFAWQAKIPGGKNSLTAAKTKLNTTIDSTNVLEGNPVPSVGSIFAASKDGATLEPVKTAGATTAAQDGREIRVMVASALGIPDTFFGSADTGNLATARTLDRPTELKFKSRQTLWQEVIQTILSHVIKWAIHAPKGKLKNKAQFDIDDEGNLDIQFASSSSNNGDKNDNKPFNRVEVIFPPILEHSITDRINAIASAVTLNGRTLAVDSPELAKISIRLMLQALGMTDVDEVTTKIFSDIDDEAAAKKELANKDDPSVNPKGDGRGPNSDDPVTDKLRNNEKPKDRKPENKDDER